MGKEKLGTSERERKIQNLYELVFPLKRDIENRVGLLLTIQHQDPISLGYLGKSNSLRSISISSFQFLF